MKAGVHNVYFESPDTAARVADLAPRRALNDFASLDNFRNWLICSAV